MEDGMPKGGFAKLVPELHVNDLDASLAFWRDACGFEIAYRREACEVDLKHRALA